MNATKIDMPTGHGKALFRGITAVVGLVLGIVLGAIAGFGLVALTVTAIACAAAAVGLIIFVPKLAQASYEAVTATPFVLSDQPRHKRNRLAALIGAIVGIIVGIDLVRLTAVHWPVVLLAAGAFAALLGVSFDAMQRSNRKAVIIGSVVGLMLGGYLVHKTTVHWPIVPLLALICAVVFGIAHSSMRTAYHNTKPSAEQQAVPIGKNHVADWKKERVQKLLEVGNIVPGNNDTAVSVITDFHVVGLLAKWLVPGGGVLFCLWGAIDFWYHRKLLDLLTADSYRLAFVVAGLVAFGYWVYRNRKQLKGMLVRAAVYAVVIVLVWIGFHLPWSQVVRDAFRSGRPLPWLLACVPFLVWMGLRFAKWFFGFFAGTDKRGITGTVYPWPFPNRTPDLAYPASSAEPIDTYLGRVFSFGHAVLEGAGSKDGVFNNLRYLRFHRDVTSTAKPR